MVKTKFFIAAGFILVLVTGFMASEYLARQTTDKTGFEIGAPFQLQNQYRQTVDESLFQGQHTALFFGFTHCPDICPTTLLDITQMKDSLANQAETLQIVFVTLDPERDTPELLRRYLDYFGTGIIGLTGSEPDVMKMASDWGIYHEKIMNEDGSYTLDHTATLFLLNPQGRLAGTITYQESSDIAFAKLQNFLK